FLQPNVDTHSVPRPQRREVLAHLCFLKLFNHAIHGSDSRQTHSGGVSTANTITEHRRSTVVLLRKIGRTPTSKHPITKRALSHGYLVLLLEDALPKIKS